VMKAFEIQLGSLIGEREEGSIEIERLTQKNHIRSDLLPNSISVGILCLTKAE
jgi:hypothetical protein